MVFEYGAMSSLYRIEAESKFVAYAGMIAHLIALYEPEEVVENDKWLNPMGQISERLDEIFGGSGSFDKFINEHIDEIRMAVNTITKVC